MEGGLRKPVAKGCRVWGRRTPDPTCVFLRRGWLRLGVAFRISRALGLRSAWDIFSGNQRDKEIRTRNDPWVTHYLYGV